MTYGFQLCALMFHRLAPLGDLWTLRPEFFCQILDYARGQGLGSLPCNRREEDAIHDRWWISLTFDDGYVSDYEVAFPELTRRQMMGTFFIITQDVGKAGRVNWSQLAEMSQAGMEIGSHTHSHPFLLQLARPQIIEELRKSKAILEDRLGVPIRALSLPNGDEPDDICSLAQEVGYRIVATSRPGFQRKAAVILPRNLVHNRVPFGEVQSLLHFSRRTVLRLQCAYLAKRAVKRTLGFERYNKLRDSLWPHS